MMRVVAYTRVSTDTQEISAEAQAKKIAAYSALYELDIVAAYHDTASGRSMDRPGLQAALHAVSVGIADGIVVAKLDRLTRSVQDLGALLAGPFAKAQLFSVGEQIDTRTAAGRLVLNILASVAQWERETISERTKDALAHKIANGERVGRVQYGFRLAADGVHQEVAPEEAAVVEQMLAWSRAGLGANAIAARLNAAGIPSRTGRWHHPTVAKILQRLQRAA